MERSRERTLGITPPDHDGRRQEGFERDQWPACAEPVTRRDLAADRRRTPVGPRPACPAPTADPVGGGRRVTAPSRPRLSGDAAAGWSPAGAAGPASLSCRRRVRRAGQTPSPTGKRRCPCPTVAVRAGASALPAPASAGAAPAASTPPRRATMQCRDESTCHDIRMTCPDRFSLTEGSRMLRPIHEDRLRRRHAPHGPARGAIFRRTPDPRCMARPGVIIAGAPSGHRPCHVAPARGGRGERLHAGRASAGRLGGRLQHFGRQGFLR